jgi:hypothetical protein
VLKSENQGGSCRWCVTRDVTFRYNRVKNAGSGVMLGGYNKAGAPIDAPINSILFQHNTFENINNAEFGGSNHIFQFADDAYNIVIDRNSMMPPLGNASMYFHNGVRSGFVITNNVLSGVLGSGKGYWNDMVSTFLPGGVFSGNLLLGSSRATTRRETASSRRDRPVHERSGRRLLPAAQQPAPGRRHRRQRRRGRLRHAAPEDAGVVNP